MLKKIIVAATLLVLMAGCSTTSTKQALIADGNWFKLGFNKGRWGEKATAEPTLQTEASEVDATMALDYDAYLRGYQKGLESYCTLEQLRQMGMEMKTDWGVCEFRRDGGGLYKMFWQQGFDRSMAFDGVTGH